MLDKARQMKSVLEGSGSAPFSPASLDSAPLSQLKHLVLAHTPADLPEELKAKMADQLSELLAGRVKTLLYACLLTCPWYSGAQKEQSSRANRNVLFVVYVALDKQFFSLTTPHNKTLLESTDYVSVCVFGKRKGVQFGKGLTLKFDEVLMVKPPSCFMLLPMLNYSDLIILGWNSINNRGRGFVFAADIY